jgi:hypothetical protein
MKNQLKRGNRQARGSATQGRLATAARPIRKASLGPKARPELYRIVFALLLLLIGVNTLFDICWPKGNYWLEGDGARYIQIAIQMASFHRLGLMPEFGPDSSRIYPPLLPATIALTKQLITGDYYDASRAVVAVSLLLSILGAFLLARLISRSALSALIAGLAVACFLIPLHSTLVLTEPLSAALYLGCLASVLILFRGKPEQEGAWVYLAAALTALVTLCRVQGAAVGIGMAVGLWFTRPRSEIRARKRDLTIIGCGWLAGVILYFIYERYMRSLGGIPLETLTHQHAAYLWGAKPPWPVLFNPGSGAFSLTPEANSLWTIFRDDPAAYVRFSWMALKSCFTQWFAILLAFHILRILPALRTKRIRWDMVLFCDISLVVMFILNTAVLFVISQHPVYIPRMFNPWVACSLATLAVSAGRLFQLPARTPLILKAISVAIALAAVGSQYGNLHDRVTIVADHHRGGAIAATVIEALKKDVPANQTIITASSGGPDIAATIAGFPDMYFADDPAAFRTQMRFYGIRYALIAPQATPNARELLADCKVVFDYPFNTLLVCPAEEKSPRPAGQ